MMIRWGEICIISLLFISFFFIHSSGKEGYDIGVDADGTVWGIGRSTQNLNLNIESKVSGSGNFSKNNYIRGISGMSFSEKSSAVRGGDFSLQDHTQLVAKEGPVYIQYALGSSGSKESVKVGIDERWITQFVNYKNMTYLGEGGVRTQEWYDDNGERIFTSSDSWKLSKESTYTSINNRTIVLAEVRPNSVQVERASNKSSLYYLGLESVGSLTRIDLISARPSDEMVSDLSEESISRNLQDYAGHVKTELVVSDQRVTTYPMNETYDNGDNSSVTVSIVE